MMNDAPHDGPPLTLSYQSFERVWKALVSKRKARKLNVDRDLVWQQLMQSGGEAAFLRSAVKNAKRDHAGDSRDANPEQNPLLGTAHAMSPAKRKAGGKAASPASDGGKTAARKVVAKRRAAKQSTTVAAKRRRASRAR